MFTPIHTTLGALLLFQGSFGLLIHNGAVFGISSLLSGCALNPSRDNVPIIAGLLSSLAPVYIFAPSLIPKYPASSLTWNSAAATMGVGFLLGWGTKVRKSYDMHLGPGLTSTERSRLYFRTYALWSFTSFASLIDSNHSFLYDSFDDCKLCQRGLQYTVL